MPTHPSHHDPDDGPAGTTRTRLPEGGSTTARRPPARSSRTLVTVVGVFVLLIAALAIATHGTGSGSSSSAAGPHAPHATSTAPTGTRPPTASAATPIPTTYPHTPEGAQSAAANYAVALGGNGMFSADSRHQIVATVYAPDVTASRQKQFDTAYTDPQFLKRVGLTSSGTAPAGMTFVSRADPVGTKLDSATSGAATVEVWYSSLFGLAGNGSTTPVAESWYTDTFQLTWTANTWKVVNFGQKDGPAPVGHDQTASSAQAITDAVNGFGGLTYAR
jgi:hypothetical protein